MKISYFIYALTLLWSTVGNSQNQEQDAPMHLSYHPFIRKLQLGSGIDINNPYQLKPASLANVQNAPKRNVPTIRFDAYIKSAEEDDDNFIKYDYKVEASILSVVGGGGELNASLKTKSTKSNIKFVLIAESIYTPEILDQTQLRLNDAAKADLQNESQFINRYGNYFCSAIYYGHRLWIEVSLRNSFSSSVLNAYLEGKVKVNLEKLSANAKSSLYTEIQRIAKEDQNSISIQAYGGPELSDYNGLVISVLKKNAKEENVQAELSKLVSGYKYENATPLECDLSDFSSWGIMRNPITQPNNISTIREIKAIYLKTSRLLENIRIILKTPELQSDYSDTQVEDFKNKASKLQTLLTELSQIHRKLLDCDIAYIGKDIEYWQKYYQLEKSIPNIFSLLCARTVNIPISFSPLTDPPQVIKSKMNGILSDVRIYSTLNSPNLLSHISSIGIENELDGKLVQEIRNLQFFQGGVLKDNNIFSVSLPDLFSNQLWDNFSTSIFDDGNTTFSKYLKDLQEAGELPFRSTQYYSYNLVVTDKYGRQFRFPLFDVKFNLIQATRTITASATQSLKQNCCLDIDEYVDIDGGRNIFLSTPNDLIISFKKLILPIADKLVVEIRTDNNFINDMIEKDGGWDEKFSKLDLLPNEGVEGHYTLNLDPNILQAVNSLTFTYYSIDKDGKTTSAKRVLEIPTQRKICNSIVYLK